MITKEELKKKNNYEFECNISEEHKYAKYHDEWGCAGIWLGEEIGAEYNFCIDNGTNYCAIYKMQFNSETGYMETDHSTFVHYEIDFGEDNWKEKLEDAMCEALISFFEL